MKEDTTFEYPVGKETLLYKPTKSEVEYFAGDELEDEVEQLQMALLVKLREPKSNWASADELEEQIDLVFEETMKKLRR